jgi:hypothetical protein
MKNYYMFAASKQQAIFTVIVCAAIFVAVDTAFHAAEIRLSISNGCCASMPVIVCCKTGKDSLSSFTYFNFSFMQQTMKNAGKVKDSNLTRTPGGAKSISIEAFNTEKSAEIPTLSLSDYPVEIQSVLSFLVARGTPVVLIFNITNNSMQTGDSCASNIFMVGNENCAASGNRSQTGK